MSAGVEMPPPWRGPIRNAAPVAGPDARLSDLSLRRRWGLKGANAADWIAAQGLTVPPLPNEAATSAGVLVARLAAQEFVLLAVADDGAATVAALPGRLEVAAPAGCYAIPRQDMSAWLRLAGTGVPAIMATLCAVDLRAKRFAEGGIAQTSVALQNAVTIRRDADGEFGIDLLTDYAGAHGLWTALAAKVAGGAAR